MKGKSAGKQIDKTEMVILALDTSCDETSAAITRGFQVLSNIIWSQASQHANFGGVVPSLAQRLHEERIDFVINKAMRQGGVSEEQVGAIAVTEGPGLAIALGVGINKAKELGQLWNVPVVGVNHIEGHLLSPLAQSNSPTPKIHITFPALGLVVSGGHTELVKINTIGNYEILAETSDDALGEALDKAARMLGLGYPGGAVLERMARRGNAKVFELPLPMTQSKIRNKFSYSGLKTAMFRLINKTQENGRLTKDQVINLAASFQSRAFQHLTKVMNQVMKDLDFHDETTGILVGGGVVANTELRRQLRKLGKKYNLKLYFPYSKKLCGDNAAMIGIAAGIKIMKEAKIVTKTSAIDRKPRWSINEVK